MKEDDLDFVVEDTTYSVRNPTAKEKQEADEIYNKTFTQAVRDKLLFRKKMAEYIREQGLWDESKETRVKELKDKINEIESKNAVGGYKLSDAIKECIEVRGWRNELRELLSITSEYDSNTVEGTADNARFNYLTSRCIIRKDGGESNFDNLDSYLNSNNDPVAIIGAIKFAQLYYNYSVDLDGDLFENRFLKKYNKLDTQLRLVNEDGHLVDSEGRLIDEMGRFVNKDGHFVDIDGNRLDASGNLVVSETQPFLDDDGNPIVEVLPKRRGKPAKKVLVKSG